jgi:hypothetical protein
MTKTTNNALLTRFCNRCGPLAMRWQLWAGILALCALGSVCDALTHEHQPTITDGPCRMSVRDMSHGGLREALAYGCTMMTIAYGPNDHRLMTREDAEHMEQLRRDRVAACAEHPDGCHRSN